jgi:hypothetical protein
MRIARDIGGPLRGSAYAGPPPFNARQKGETVADHDENPDRAVDTDVAATTAETIVPLREALLATRRTPGFELLAAALAKAQGEFLQPQKTATARVTMRDNKGVYTFDYAPLDEIIKAVKAALSKYGIAVIQDVTQPSSSEVSVSTILLHESGQAWVSGSITMQANADPKIIGGVITYARRYSITATLNLAASDDKDAEGLEGGGEQRGRARGQQQQRPAPRQQERGGNREPMPEPEGAVDHSKDGDRINAQAQGRLLEIACEHKVSVKRINDFLKKYGIENVGAIPRGQYDMVLAWIQTGGADVAHD